MRGFRSIQLTTLVSFLLCYDYGFAYARFILEFTDGRKITVSNYEDLGQSIRVYTPNGSFAFRKEDVARIIDQKPPTQFVQAPVETPPPSRQLPETSPLVSPPVTPRAIVHDDPPLLPGWDFIAGVALEGLYRARFFVALFIGLKVFQFFLPASFR